MTDINQTLEERQKTHGDFYTHALLSQALKKAFNHFGKSTLDDDQQEAIDMILHKIARIGNGNPDTHDHWHDIAGYATLVANRLTDNKKGN
jgi:hypothetical protein